MKYDSLPLKEVRLEDVRRFAGALDLALYDKALDRRHEKIIYLVDADVAIDVIVGLTAWDPSSAAPDVTDWNYVVQALISTGYVPKLQFLWPHLVEFDRFIGRIYRPSGHDNDLRSTSLRLLAEQWQLANHDEVLADSPDNGEALASFVREEGFEIFVKIELCYGGTAYDRLLRLCRHIDLAEISTFPGVRPKDDLVEKMTELVSAGQQYYTPRKARPINARVDGYALAELARMVSAGLPVRFYTHTSALSKQANLSEFKDASGRTVFRDRDYFVMRCSFPALSFSDLVEKKKSARSEEGKGTSVKHLEQIRDILFETLEGGGRGNAFDPKHLEHALGRTEARSLRVTETLDDFKRLKFLSEVFLRWELPKPMAAFLPYLRAKLEKTSLVEETRRELSESHDEISAALDERVGHLRNWKRDFIEIQNAIRDVRKDWETEPQPWRDLGLGRWGLQVTLSADAQRRLQEWIEAVNAEEVKEQNVSDFALMIAAQEYETVDDLAVALCVLWTLKLYKAIVREWQEVSAELRSKAPIGLEVLYLVARIKTVHKNEEQPAKLVMKRIYEAIRSAEEFCERTASRKFDLDKAVGQMCLAHVTYWAWARAREMNDKNAVRLAEQSYRASDRAASLLSSGSLMWAFAVNHSAYIRIRADVDRDKTQDLLRILGNLNEEHDHYRIADTRAWAFTEQVERIVAKHGFSMLLSDKSLLNIRRGACEHIASAYRRLTDGKPCFGDIEVVRHRDRLEELKLAFECLLIEGDAPSASNE